jgi:hypothetical protein
MTTRDVSQHEWRDSISAKAARSTAEPASRRIVRTSPQPTSGTCALSPS